MSKWIKCSEQMPEGGKPVLVFAEKYVIEAVFEPANPNKPLDGYCWRVATLDVHGCGCCGGDYPEVDYWMPLPAPPEGK